MIYIHKNGKDLGSFDLLVIQQGLQDGTFQSQDWAWRTNMETWKPLGEVLAHAVMMRSAVGLPKLHKYKPGSQTARLL